MNMNIDDIHTKITKSYIDCKLGGLFRNNTSRGMKKKSESENESQV